MFSRITRELAAAPKPRSFVSVLRRFGREERGSVGLAFGLMTVPCIMMVGMAVDYARMVAVRNQTQVVLDNAALAGGRAAQLNSSNAAQSASDVAKAYFNAQTIPHAIQSQISDTATANAAGTEFTWSLTSWVATPFMSAAAVRYYDAPDGGPAQCSRSGWFCQKITVSTKAVLSTGGKNDDNNVETSLMLDVTGSMSGTKITDLKAAAKDLIDIVVWDDQSKSRSRVAVVPFAQAVNVGATIAPIVRGPVASGTNPTTDVIGSGYQYFKFTRKGGGGTKTYKISTTCVTERIGDDAFTDAAPASAATYVGRFYPDTSGNCSLVTSDGEVNLLTPLSNDRTMLKSRIDRLTLAGSTAGQIGTAWAWYTLSPNWNDIFTGASQPASYSDRKTRKIAVLMTDGDYNTEYWNGVEAKTSSGADANYNANNGASEVQAPKLCSAMKAQGIEVFTVGFQVSTAAKALLMNCATDASHYYDATSGDALKQSFRDIALKISTLRIAQ